MANPNSDGSQGVSARSPLVTRSHTLPSSTALGGAAIDESGRPAIRLAAVPAPTAAVAATRPSGLPARMPGAYPAPDLRTLRARVTQPLTAPGHGPAFTCRTAGRGGSHGVDAEPGRRSSSELESSVCVVSGCDHVAAPIRVDLDGADGLADFDVEACLQDPRRGANAVETLDGNDLPERKRPGAGGQETDRYRAVEARLDHGVANRLPEGL